MKKLTLNVEELRVQSFAASPETREHAPAAAERTRPHVCDPITFGC